MEAPDSAGYWAFEGHIKFKDGLYPRDKLLRWHVRVYWGDISKQYFAQHKTGIRPTKMLVGKWHKLHTPD